MDTKIRKGKLIIGLLCVVSLFISTAYSFQRQNNNKINTVVIDAGHGGKDGGCSGMHSKEKDVALSIALKLGKKIKTTYPNINVIYTRKTDVFIPLHERAEIANKNKADLFISIHCNAIAKKHAHKAFGTETYVLGLHRAETNLQVAKRENEAILLESDYKANYDGFDPNSPETHIMLSLIQNAYLNQSIAFATKIENQFKTRTNRTSRGVKQAGFLVLRATTMPSVLIEAGFLSNNDEETFLRTEKGQYQMANAIFAAFGEYKAEIEITPNTKTAKPMMVAYKTMPNEFTHKGGQAIKEKVKVPKEMVVYKIQVAVTSKPLATNHPLNAFDGLEVEKVGNVYKYMIGTFMNYPNTVLTQKELKQNGYPDAFITAYKNGKRISIKEAKNN